jgi:hypothetical protein
VKKITAIISQQTLEKLGAYRQRVIDHRRRDVKYLDSDYSLSEAAGVLIGYGLDMVDSISPEEEEQIGIPEGFDLVAVGPRVNGTDDSQ